MKGLWLWIRQYWPSLTVGAGIVYLSLFYAASLPLDVRNPDKFSHFFAYFVWVTCLTCDLRRAGLPFGRVLLWAVVFPILFGGAIELLQSYCFPPRAGEWLDWHADSAGTIAAFVLTDTIIRFIHARTRR